jgi:hypothetical protein
MGNPSRFAVSASVDEVGLAVVETRADIERVAVVKHVDLGALARCVELDGRDLMEVVDHGRALPHLLVEHAVDRRPLRGALDAHAFRRSAALGCLLCETGPVPEREREDRAGAAQHTAADATVKEEK